MPYDRSKYPPNWTDLSKEIRFGRAGGRCECTGECGRAHPGPAGARCSAFHGMDHPETGAHVVLTTAHLDHDPANCTPENLRALCQLCHNRLDAPTRSRRRAAGLFEKHASARGQSLTWNTPAGRPVILNQKRKP